MNPIADQIRNLFSRMQAGDREAAETFRRDYLPVVSRIVKRALEAGGGEYRLAQQIRAVAAETSADEPGSSWNFVERVAERVFERLSSPVEAAPAGGPRDLGRSTVFSALTLQTQT